jgi:hypothetical protein
VSSGGTSRPVSPEARISLTAPTSVAITGNPQAIASRITVGIPSERGTEERTRASKPGISSGTLVPASRSAKTPSKPRAAASARTELSYAA